MKIATMVRSWIPWPRPRQMNYAPIDVALSTANGLAAAGHEVTVYAPEGSNLEGYGLRLRTLDIEPLTPTLDDLEALLDRMDLFSHGMPQMYDNYYAQHMYASAQTGEFDLLHFHHPEVGLMLASAYPTIPVAYTLHDVMEDWTSTLYDMYAGPQQHFISISDNQRKTAPNLNYAATVHNGTDISLFTPSFTPGDYLLCVGSVMGIKGTKEAVEIARRTGEKLLILGAITHNGDEYFNAHIAPYLNENIRYLGVKPYEELPGYYRNAKALLTPVQREEPFGLTTIEAMACGTPVISLNRGAAQEIIDNGLTGYLCDSINDMAQAVGNIATLDRHACRKSVETNFSLQAMIEGYERTFTALTRP